jgi:hypothetical protein
MSTRASTRTQQACTLTGNRPRVLGAALLVAGILASAPLAPDASASPSAASGSKCAKLIRGTRGADNSVGTPGGDRIKARAGGDRVDGLQGEDCLNGGRGSDRIQAVDGEVDSVSCGRGEDKATVDVGDSVTGCEQVEQQDAGPSTEPSQTGNEAAQSPASTSPSSPPPGPSCDLTAAQTTLPDLQLPGCNPSLDDTASSADPTSTWGKIDCETSSRHRHLTGDGDTHPTPLGGPQGDDAYRRMTAIDGDDVWGERCELGLNAHQSGPTALYREGQRWVTFISLRLPGSFPLDTTTWQVVMQMKQTQPSANGGGTPVLSLEARAGRWRLMQSTSSGASSDTRELWSAPAQQGVWTQFAFDVVYSQDPSVGSIKVYADLNGDADAQDTGEQSPATRTYTLKRETEGGSSTDGIAPGESIPSHLRTGIYHNPSIACPPPNGCSVDVDNVQVVG